MPKGYESVKTLTKTRRRKKKNQLLLQHFKQDIFKWKKRRQTRWSVICYKSRQTCGSRGNRDKRLIPWKYTTIISAHLFLNLCQKPALAQTASRRLCKGNNCPCTKLPAATANVSNLSIISLRPAFTRPLTFPFNFIKLRFSTGCF